MRHFVVSFLIVTQELLTVGCRNTKKNTNNYFYFYVFLYKVNLAEKQNRRQDIYQKMILINSEFIVTQYCDNKILIYIMLPSYECRYML